MHIIYTTQTAGFKDGFSYRNPRYFDGVESDAIEVTVVGDWPVVAQAYAKAGIEVRSVKLKGQHQEKEASGNNKPSKQVDGGKALTITQIKEFLAAKEIEIPAGVTKRDDLIALLEAAE